MYYKNKLSFLCIFLGFLILLSACGIENESHLEFNEWYEVGNWEVKLTQIEVTDYFIFGYEGEAFLPRVDYQFVIIYVSLHNKDVIEREFAPWPPTFLSLTEALNIDMDIGEIRRWTPSNLTLYQGGILVDKFDILDTAVAPDEVLVGVVAFEISTAIINDMDRVLNLYFSNGDEELIYNLRALLKEG